MTFYKNILGHLATLRHDLACDREAIDGRILWINGLAKSGTSLIEDIVYQLGYVDGTRSLLRPRLRLPKLADAVLDEQLFSAQPRRKKTYLKTHCLYSQKLDPWVDLYNVSPVIVMRDVRDALVSRYHHICSDPTHWDFLRLKNLPESVRFKSSVLVANPVYKLSQLEYYIFWIHSWFDSPFSNRIIWYESYLNSPELFIDKIAAACHAEKYNSQTIELCLSRKRAQIASLSSDLAKRRLRVGSRSGTFRTGEAGQNKKYFDAELDDLFCRLIHKYGLENLHALD